MKQKNPEDSNLYSNIMDKENATSAGIVGINCHPLFYKYVMPLASKRDPGKNPIGENR